MNIPDFPILSFPSPREWENWLEKNHDKYLGIWIKFFKKNSGITTVTYPEALEEALCYGWIDSQSKKFDEKSYLQKFTPRRPNSIWSKINKRYITRLIKSGKMKTPGLKKVEEAKKNGQWKLAYNSPSDMKMPEDFLDKLKDNKRANLFFKTLNKTNKYAIAWRLQTAKKPETKRERMKKILEMLENSKKFHE